MYKTKDGKEASVENLTADNYLVEAGEERSYHCVIESKVYDPRTGKKLSVPRLQKFGRKIFESVVRSALLKQGYEVKILHDPTVWAEQHKSELAARRKALDAAAKEAEQKRFDDAVAAAVAKALAEKKPRGKKMDE